VSEKPTTKTSFAALLLSYFVSAFLLFFVGTLAKIVDAAPEASATAAVFSSFGPVWIMCTYIAVPLAVIAASLNWLYDRMSSRRSLD